MSTKLPLLERRRPELETCAYCPKLCRAKCPVSNATGSESLTPWGKMTMSLLAARGEVPAELSYTRLAWGCTGCHACTRACEHSNPVHDTLVEARSLARHGRRVPEGVERMLERRADRANVLRRRVSAIARELELPERAGDALVIGCGYLLYEPELARRLTASVQALLGQVMLVSECCGAPERAASDELGYTVQARRIEQATRGAERIIVHDAGCAIELRGPRTQTLVEIVADHSERLSEGVPGLLALGPLRYHDPCQLGRGLGQYRAPRRILERLLGYEVQEFTHNQADAICSGGGSLLPESYPDVARSIARARVAEHRGLGGGTIVTACASSLRQFKRAQADAVDLGWLMAQGILPK